jgi:hypothetical protein
VTSVPGTKAMQIKRMHQMKSALVTRAAAFTGDPQRCANMRQAGGER